jgi:hypothetical protein
MQRIVTRSQNSTNVGLLYLRLLVREDKSLCLV